MLPIKKFFVRKYSESRKPSSNDDELDENTTTRQPRRHSSGRRSFSTEAFHDPTLTKMPTRKSFLFSRSPFKRRNSTSACHVSHSSVCTCSEGRNNQDVNSTGLRRSSAPFQNDVASTATSAPRVADVPDENGVGRKTSTQLSSTPDENGNATTATADATNMNGTCNHHSWTVCDQPLDLSYRGSPKLSAIERKILNQKRNTTSTDIDRRDSLRTEAVNHRNFNQFVPDGIAVDASPRLYTKAPGAATLATRIDRCSSPISAHSSASVKSNGFSSQFPVTSNTSACVDLPSTSVGLQNIDPNIVPTAGLMEDSHISTNGHCTSPSDLSVTSDDILQYTDSMIDESVSSESPESLRVGISHVGITSQAARLPTFSSDISARTTGSENYGDAPVPPPRRNRSRGRLSCAGDLTPYGGTAPRLHAGQPLVRTAKSRSLSELFWSEFDGSGLADRVGLSRTSTTTSGVLPDVSLPSVTSSSAFSAGSASSPLMSSPLTLNSDQPESCSTSFCSTSALSPSISTAAAASDSDPAASTLISSSSSSTPLSVHVATSEQVVSQEISPLPSTLPTTSDPAEETHSIGERLTSITSEDPDRSGNPLLSTRPLTSLRALRYSSNWIADCCVRNSPEHHDSTTSTLARMSGLTLDHVMTPPRITMATVAVADRSSPDIVVTEADISQLSHADNSQSVADFQTSNTRTATASPEPERELDVQCELSIEHCLKGYRTRSLLSVGEKAESCEIIKEVLTEEDVDDDYRLYELISKRHDLPTTNQQSDAEQTDDVMALEYESRPLIGRHSVSPCFHLRRKKNTHIKIVCDSVSRKRRTTQLEIAANATCCTVIRSAMQSFDMLCTEDPSDYSLIQIDRLTKEIHRVREASVVADLKKDYFLLCKKENLARTSSARKCTRSLDVDASCSATTRIISPTSPCQWNVGFSRLQQLDSVFDADAKSATPDITDDDVVQSEAASLRRQLEEKERRWIDEIARLRKCLERFKQSALAADEETRVRLLEQQRDELATDLELHQQTILYLTTQLSTAQHSSTGEEFPENREALQAELQQAKNHLAVTLLEHKQLLRVLENIKHRQQAAMTSLYDAISTCATTCYLCHVTVEMSHLSQVKIAAASDDWLTVGDAVENCSLLPGDRLVELNSRLVCGLSVGKFNDIVTSSQSDDEQCRLVVLRNTAVETGHESNSLSQDISHWMKNFT